MDVSYSEEASQPGVTRAPRLSRERPGAAAARPGLRATLPWLRRLLTVGALVFAGLAAYDRRHELAEAARLLGRIDLVWLGVAIGCQVASMVVFARLQRWLLRAGGVRVGLRPMVEITLAANALGTSLPGGAAWSATWAFSQLRRRGADRVLAVWVLLVAGALASFALFVLVTVGSWVAGPTGPAAQARPVTAALAAIPVAAGLIWYLASRIPAVRSTLARSWRAAEVLPGVPRLGRAVAGLMRRLGTVQPGPLGWLEAFGLALANWLYDAVCLTSCLLALHVRVPWAAMLVIYALTQIAASLPITPGGLGVVEGSLTLLLVAYGVPATDGLAAVLLYRIVSFWALVPVGWIIWLLLEVAIRARVRARPHPWATHAHGPHPGGATVMAPDRILQPALCTGCDQPLPAAGTGVAHHSH
ncbi:MAG: lysylphosphatidylglycerol synthase transmembrane domain-containing protein [Micromonosporaceae bacterium]